MHSERMILNIQLLIGYDDDPEAIEQAVRAIVTRGVALDNFLDLFDSLDLSARINNIEVQSRFDAFEGTRLDFGPTAIRDHFEGDSTRTDDDDGPTMWEIATAVTDAQLFEAAVLVVGRSDDLWASYDDICRQVLLGALALAGPIEPTD